MHFFLIEIIDLVNINFVHNSKNELIELHHVNKNRIHTQYGTKPVILPYMSLKCQDLSLFKTCRHIK